MSDFGIPMTSFDGSTGAAPATSVAAPPPPAVPQLSVIPELHMPTDAQSGANQVATFAVAGLNASEDAAVKNNAVLQSVQAAQDKNYAAIIEANQNLHKINSMPKGIVKILGMFDDSWNASNQALNVEAANTTQEHVVNQAKTIMQINNTIPDLIEKQTGIARELSTNQLAVDANSLQHQAAARDAQRLRMESIKTSIDMSQEQRAATEFKIGAMGVEDTNAAIAKIKADPNSPNRNMLGMLEEHAAKTGTAIAAFQAAQTAAAKGNREEENAQMQTFTDNLPVSQLVGPAQQAMASGASTVTFGQGKNTIQIPLPTVLRSMQANQKLDADSHAMLAQQAATDGAIAQRTQTISSGATALASIDPRAKNVVDMLGHASKALAAAPTYGNILQYNAVLDNSEKQIKDIATTFSKNFGTKEAQAGVVQFGETGKFNRTSGQAVLADSIGNSSLGNTTKYAPAFQVLNQAVAKQLAAAQVQGGAGITGQVGTMDSADLMAMLSSSKSNPKLAQIKDNVINDGTTMNAVRDVMKSTLQKDALDTALNNLAHSKNASPLWQNLISHQDQIMSQVAPGKFAYDPNKMAQVFENASVMTHGKVNYGGAFISALRTYGSQADAIAGSDSRYTIYDHALEASAFGDKPHSAIVSDWAGRFSRVVEKAHTEMQARIQQDVSGKTQAQATSEAALNSNRGVDLPDPAKVPSATGTGLTAQQIKSLYGGN